MKSYTEYLTESASVYNETKSLDHAGLTHALNAESFDYHKVRGILDNPHAAKAEAVTALVHKAGNIDSKGLGLLTMHAMSNKESQLRNQHAYHLVGSGKLSDDQLSHIAKHALYPLGKEHPFDDHLANRIVSSAKNKEKMGEIVRQAKLS